MASHVYWELRFLPGSIGSACSVILPGYWACLSLIQLPPALPHLPQPQHSTFTFGNVGPFMIIERDESLSPTSHPQAVLTVAVIGM